VAKQKREMTTKRTAVEVLTSIIPPTIQHVNVKKEKAELSLKLLSRHGGF
jgi:hypothetical protein